MNKCPVCRRPWPTLAEQEAQRQKEREQYEWTGYERRLKNAHGSMVERPKGGGDGDPS